MSVDVSSRVAHSDTQAKQSAFGARDLLKWLGHSVVAGLIAFFGLWALVSDFTLERSLRYGVGVTVVAFFLGLAYFAVVYAVARAAGRQKADGS